MACAAIITSAPNAAHAQVGISASIQINATADFYQPLTPYGSWVDVGSYGRCWRPREVEVGWQPYTVGSWEWTDAGWYWNSDEPWAWACYHYGSWYSDPRIGWVWIPATDWAPAWVTWRSSDAYIGWAPCGPGRAVLAASFFTFCDVHRFRDHFNRRDLIVNNTTIINRTRVIRDFQRQTVDFDGRQRTIYANRGPGVDSIQRATGTRFTPRPVRDVVRESPRPDNVRRDGDQRRNGDQRPANDARPTPAPTGRDQPRNYQQQNNQQQRDIPRQEQQAPIRPRQPEQRVQPDQKPALPPTGRDEPRVRDRSQQPQQQAPLRPQQPEQRVQPNQRPEVPQQRPGVMPPTGRDEPRVYHETPKPTPAPEQRREVPVPPQRPVTPPERPLPPTGRDQAPGVERRQAAPPAQAPAARPSAPVTPQGHDGERGRDGKDGKDRNP